MFPSEEDEGFYAISDFNEMAIDYENGFVYVGAKYLFIYFMKWFNLRVNLVNSSKIT